MLLAAVAGLGPEVGLTVSLARRVRELEHNPVRLN